MKQQMHEETIKSQTKTIETLQGENDLLHLELRVVERTVLDISRKVNELDNMIWRLRNGKASIEREEANATKGTD